MKRITIVAIVLLAGGGCGGGSGDTETAEPLTQAQKDSILGSLPVPGASGVLGALGVAEKARARAEQHDTMR